MNWSPISSVPRGDRVLLANFNGPDVSKLSSLVWVASGKFTDPENQYNSILDVDPDVKARATHWMALVEK